jgi:Co/Zn/Cd efflux system component
MRYLKFLFIAIVVIVFSSCHNSSKKSQNIITERIQYDVTIKNSDPDNDWWIQNIEGSEREAFVNMIMDAAYSGKYRVYDYFNKPLTPEQVKTIGSRRVPFTLQRTTPPYESYDTLIEQNLELRDITRVRFLEEWYMDEQHFIMNKKVVGMGPVIEDFDENGNFRGYRLLFWIYLDEKYPVL